MTSEEHFELVADKLYQLLRRWGVTLHSNYRHKLVLTNEDGEEFVLSDDNIA